ncbi:MAG: hypothetical protein HWD59_06885 [Coxiellaceae bacterium]|nr:MAG: hypothetical protein HWD59_06885 [Coxiellaceae bacterium]
MLFYSSRKQNVSHRATLICPQVQVLRKTDEIPAHGELEFASTTSLSNFHAYASYWLLEAPMREEIVENMRELLKDDTSEEVFQPLHGKAAEWGGKPFDDFPSDVVMGLKNKFAYARVNLHASNEQIKKDFALWLAAERKRRNQSTSKKNFNDIDFVSWYESAVLPYLDLTFWATTENVKINQYAIAQAIFTDAYAVGSDVDPLGKLKTTKKKAEYLMNYETIKLLELQITDFANSR